MLLVEDVEIVLIVVGLRFLLKEKILILNLVKLRLKGMEIDMVIKKVILWTVLLLVLHLFISILLMLLHLEHSFLALQQLPHTLQS